MYRCHSMQVDEKVHRYRFASDRIGSHQIASVSRRDSMQSDAIRCKLISMPFFIELHRMASMPLFRNPVFKIPVFRVFEETRRNGPRIASSCAPTLFLLRPASQLLCHWCCRVTSRLVNSFINCVLNKDLARKEQRDGCRDRWDGPIEGQQLPPPWKKRKLSK